MKYASAIRSILERAPNGLTPQQIRDEIKLNYPALYDNPVARNNVARGHYKDLDLALLSRIYTASKSSKHYTRDESVEPIVVSLSDGAHRKISITRFFAETLQVPLSNSRWSWGAYSADKNVVVLRAWEDERRVIDGQQMVRIHLPGAGSSRGEAERKRHMELLSRGVPGFAVMCEAIDTEAPAREIASFEDQVVERLGALHTGPDGGVWAEIVGEVAVDEFNSEVAQLSAPVRVSTLLTPGQVYTREELALLLKTSDAAINNGIFRPAGYSSVLLFVTEQKASDRTQYFDHLEGDTLQMQGQSQGRTDGWLAEHRKKGLELLLFYRKSRAEYPKAGFRFEGSFAYKSHTGAKPSNFVLERDTNQLALSTEVAEQQGAFDASNDEDQRDRTIAAIVRRRGQPKFRRELIDAYGRRCAISGCDVVDVLEAAHIKPYRGTHTNHVVNGLLLRADLHTLFDLRLIAIEPATMTVWIADALQATDFASLKGVQLRLPSNPTLRPDESALRAHFNEATALVR